jgi:autotransporter-associated beta strand protein
VVNSATLMFSNPGDVTVTNPISGSGRIVKNGAGTLTLEGAYSGLGITEVNEGALVVAGALSSSNALSLTGTRWTSRGRA